MKSQYGETKGFSCHMTEIFENEPHFHEEIELIYLYEGSGILSYANEKHQMKEGDFSLIFPLKIHSFQNISESKQLCCVFEKNFFPSFSSTFANCIPEKSPLISKADFTEEVDFALDQLLKMNSIKSSSSRSQAYISILLENILEKIPLVEQQDKGKKHWKSELFLYLQEHFTEKVTLDQISIALGKSKYHVSHCFKESLGCSLSQYVHTLRVEKAKELLMTTDFQVTDIAFDCGFDSLSSFFRIFKEIEKETPKEFRERKQKELVDLHKNKP